MEIAAFLLLRLTLAWLFLLPIKGLISDWNNTINLVRLIAPFKPQFFATLMILVMIFGSISILFGIYAQVGALFLFVYSLMGFVVHYRLSKNLDGMTLSASASKQDKVTFQNAKALGVVGHVTSAQKNIVIAVALLVIVLLGSGPFSLLPLF